MGHHSLRSRQKLLIVLLRVWQSAPTTKSDFARGNADEISALSSGGELTTALYPGCKRHGRHWKLTPRGITLLWHLADKEHGFLKSNVIKQVCEISGEDRPD